jgi:hypothetical protein
MEEDKKVEWLVGWSHIVHGRLTGDLWRIVSLWARRSAIDAYSNSSEAAS